MVQLQLNSKPSALSSMQKLQLLHLSHLLRFHHLQPHHPLQLFHQPLLLLFLLLVPIDFLFKPHEL
jgi:hypothetical protein